MAVSVTHFIDSAAALGLLTGDEAAALSGNIEPDQRSQDADALARQLVRDGKLTRFQAAAIYQQKIDGVVLGNYVVLDLLGTGGMGQVFRARHRKMDRVVALKVLPKKNVSSPEAIDRFQREVKAAAKLTHPNIVTAYDADEAGGTHFLVMEYVEGSDLSVLVRNEGPLRLPQAVSCILQAARGLQHAHAAGVIHRDVKPSNLLLDKTGNIKILDMGLARIAEPNTDAGAPASNDLTHAGQLMGTIDYIAPEQALDTHQADARADIYSLGCTFYYLLTGRAPYGGATPMERLVAHRECPVPSLRVVRPEVSAELEQVYRRMVAKHAVERYQSMGEVIAALDALGRSPAAAIAPPAGRRRRTNLLLGAGGVAGLVIALVALIAVRQQPAGDGSSEQLALAPASSAATASFATATASETAPPAPAPFVEPRLTDLPQQIPDPADPVPVRDGKPSAPVVAQAAPARKRVEPPHKSAPAPTALAMQPTEPTVHKAAPAVGRQAIPDTMLQKAALTIIKQLFEADYDAAKDVDGKTALAEKLLAEAEKTTDDPTGRYVLLCEARDVAAELADTAMIDEAVDALEAGYRIDALSMQAELYRKMAAKPRPAAANRLLAEKALTLADVAIDAQQLETSEQFLKAASLMAGKAHDAASIRLAKVKSDELTALGRQIEEVAKAKDALAKNADDPDANLALGKFLCLDQDDWEAGLPYLARGSDTTLKELAASSIPAPTTPTALADLGDRWWDAAAARKGKDAALVRSGAQHWYAAALPALAGVNKAKVEKRLAENEAGTGIARKRARPIAKPNPAAVDLLKMIDLSRDVVTGSWTFEGTSLVIPEGRAVKLQLPFIPPAAYSLTASVTRRAKTGPLVLGLVLDGRQFCLIVDGGFSGISTIDGKYVRDNDTATKSVPLEPEKPAKIHCVITNSRVVADIDGKQFLDWKGDAQRLSIDSGYVVPNPNALFIGGNGGSFTVNKLEIGAPPAE